VSRFKSGGTVVALQCYGNGKVIAALKHKNFLGDDLLA